MKKIKEISLNPSYGLEAYPMHKRSAGVKGSVYTAGGPSMSADSHASRVTMSRVNKNMKNEDIDDIDDTDEEIDEFVDNINLIKEFALPETMTDKILSLGKSGVMSIPVFGDLFAFTKFLFTIYKLKRASRAFTRKFEKMVNLPSYSRPVDGINLSLKLGNDFLEPEGSISSNKALDSNLSEACYRLSNLKEFPDLDITMIDISSLKDKYFQLFRYTKDAIMEFIGFADIAIGQQGFYANAGISLVSYSSFPEYILGEYSNMINDMSLKLNDKVNNNTSHNSIITFFKELLQKSFYIPRKALDKLGNLDILINPEKLARLAKVHKTLLIFDDVNSNQEKHDLGLDAELGTNYFNFLKKIDINPIDLDLNVKDTLTSSLSENVSLNKLAKNMSFYLNEEYSLIEIYEDEISEEDSVDEHFVGGGVVAIGKKLDGTVETDKERQKRVDKANIYNEELRKIQDWKMKTTGQTK